MADVDNEALVEQVARAIYDDDHRGLSNCYSWDDGWEPHQEHRRSIYLRQARAAIAAHDSALRDQLAAVEARVEAAWRDGWAECRERLSEDEAFCLTVDVEEDAWLDSKTRAALKDTPPHA